MPLLHLLDNPSQSWAFSLLVMLHLPAPSMRFQLLHLLL